jgi:hypothetical protein
MSLEKEVQVIAELYHGNPVKAYLVGEDNCLYQYKDVMHSVNPFSRTVNTKLNIDDDATTKMLYEGILEYCPEFAEIYGSMKREYTIPPHLHNDN